MFLEIMDKYFTWIITGLLILFHLVFYTFPFFKSIKKNDFSNTEAISAASNFGVLGTFIGITYGLWFFDSNNLNVSVPTLLEGMKTAFVTSVIGMIWALFLRKCLRTGIDKYNEENSEVGKDYSQLIADNNVTQQKILESLNLLINTIGGDGDSTLVSQIKNLRTENRDELRALKSEFIAEFKKFAETMAENNSKAFIEALKETIQDFNTKIQDQFGENFKQLNIAVGKLLEWQENYKITLESICGQYKEIGQNLDLSKIAMEAMAEHSNHIEKTANSLSDIIVTAEKYEEELKETLNNLVQISNQAKEAVPNIEGLFDSAIDKSNKLTLDYIANITKGQNEGVQSMIAANDTLNNIIADSVDKALAKNNEIMDKYVDVQNDIIRVCQQSLETVDNKLKDELNKMDTITRDLVHNLEVKAKDIDNNNAKAIEAIKAATENLENSSLEVTKRVGDIIVKITNDSNESLKKQQENMIKNLSDTSNALIKGFATELAKISQKFAQDYGPITNRLRTIMEMAGRQNNNGIVGVHTYNSKK